MQEQNYAKHAMFVPMYHTVLFGIIITVFNRIVRQPVAVAGRS